MDLKGIRDVLTEMGCKVCINEYEGESRLNAFIKLPVAKKYFSVDFDFDGTAEDFVKRFCKIADDYNVDEMVEHYLGYRGMNNVPDSGLEIVVDCQKVKMYLLELAKRISPLRDQVVKEWIIGVGGTAEDGVNMSRFTGTVDDVKEELIKRVLDERSENKDCFDYGTDDIYEVVKRQGCESYYAYNCFNDYHTDYEATEISEIF